MILLCIKKIHNILYTMFIVFSTVRILFTLHTLYILNVYALFYILLSFCPAVGALNVCVLPQNIIPYFVMEWKYA
jgi:hypothetical protein